MNQTEPARVAAPQDEPDTVSAELISEASTEAAAIAKIVSDLTTADFVTISHQDGTTAEIAVLSKGLAACSLKPFFDEVRPVPERRKGTAKFQELASFIAHAKRFADTDSALFADRSATSPSLTSVLDYHRATADGSPRFGTHRGLYAFPLSPEWVLWLSANGKPLEQAAFAEFVENHIVDVADPSTAGDGAQVLAKAIGCTFASPAKLLELSRGLSMRAGIKVRNATNLATGEAQFQYATEHQDETGAPLRVPGAFLIAIPVFRASAPYQIPVRLRYRLRDQNVSWHYEMYRQDRVFDHAFQEACDSAQSETSLPIFVGSPE